MKDEELQALLRRIEGLEHEFGDIVHFLNEAAVAEVKNKAETNSDTISTVQRGFVISNAARQARAIEALMAVLRHMLHKPGRVPPNDE